MAGPPSTQIDLRSSLNPVGVINDSWQARHSKIKQIFLKRMLVERKQVADFEQLLKQIDFIPILNFTLK